LTISQSSGAAGWARTVISGEPAKICTTHINALWRWRLGLIVTELVINVKRFTEILQLTRMQMAIGQYPVSMLSWLNWQKQHNCRARLSAIAVFLRREAMLGQRHMLTSTR
jgi:hypothetical protein